MQRLAVVTLALLAVLVFAFPGTARATPVPVTVTIERFIQIQNPDPAPGQGCCGDYYAKVRINGFSPETSGEIDDQSDISPFWTFTKTVDSSLGTIPITIEIWDADSFLAAPDDIMDLNPIDGVQSLSLFFNLATGTWSGDTPSNVGFSQGDGDHEEFGLTEGGEAGAILFGISLSGNGDTDGDGIPDDVERFGVRDGGGNLVANMAAMGADPCRKTIAIEIDWMAGAADGHTHMPTNATVNDAVAAMNAAPLPAAASCPYAGFPTQATGVNLIIDRSNSIPEQATFPLSSLAGVRDGGNFNPARRPYFHYALFVHDQSAGNSSSGVCCSDNRDFLVSLGSWSNEVGTFRDQSGSILHELGHSLGLGHGGDTGKNYKPNYLSVMNYSFDPTGIPDPTIAANIDTDGNGTPDQSFRLDYSRSVLPTLAETALVEANGIGDGTDFTTWTDSGWNGRTGQGNGALDWTGDGIINPGTVSVDIDNDDCVSAGGNNTLDTAPSGDDVVTGGVIRAGPDFVCNTTKSGDDSQDIAPGTNVLESLTGWDDWSNIKFRAAMSPDAGGAAFTHGPDITYEQAQLLRSIEFAFFRPDLAITKVVDLSDATPGDTLTYTVTVTNSGTGPAKDVQLVDTLPSGATQTRSLGILAAGASNVQTFTYVVPFPIADNTTLTNGAVVSGTNLLNNPEQNTANNSATASTIVHTPVLTLSKAATAFVNAGSAITYTINYENVGSGAAFGVVITDTLPAGVYYSYALDLGSGPQPTSVTPNADGTTTLTWNVGPLSGHSGPRTIVYTARPGLLFLGGSSFSNSVTLDFTDKNGNDYPALTASAPTGITTVAPTRDPQGIGFWRSHPELWTAEVLAAVQATDKRFDGADGSLPNGVLSPSEVAAALVPGGNMTKVLEEQLLATYLNLATRRINAGTAISSRIANRLGLTNVRDAALYAIATLALPVDSSTRSRYTDATTVLDEINANRSEVY